MHWLHGVAALLLIAGGLAGMGLVIHPGLVPARVGDCLPPPGGTICYTVGHPYLWIGVLVLIVAIVGTVILWRIGTNPKAGRTSTGYTRE